MSNRPVSRNRWRIALLALGLLCVGGAALIAALALGAADPSRAPRLILDTITPSVSNPLSAPPYTLELNATNSGPPESAWGLWVGADENDALVFLIDNQGYVSVAHGVERDWSQFIHLRPQTNALTLNVEADGSATFRVNGEIAWRGSIETMPESRWGIATEKQPQLDWNNVRVFAS